MYNGKRVVVVMPAYNAARTIQTTYDEVMRQGVVDLVVLVDDASRDETVAIARTLPNTKVVVHQNNRGVAEVSAGDLAAAERSFRTAVEQRPDYAEARANLEKVRSMLSRPNN